MGSEEEFFAQLLETFKIEATEHLKSLSDGLLSLEKPLLKEQKEAIIETIFREAHSLKGAARSVNLQSIQTICQALENVFSLWKQNKIEISSHSFDILHHTIKEIEQALTKTLDISQINKTVEKLNSLCVAQEAAIQDTAAAKSESARQPLQEQPPSNPLKSQTVERALIKSPIIEKTGPPSGENDIKPQTQAEALTKQNVGDKTIRVSLQKMNRLFQEVEETLMIKLFFKQQLGELKQFQFNLRMQEKELFNFFESVQLLRQNLLADGSSRQNQESSQKILFLLDQQLRGMKTIIDQFNKMMKDAEQNSHAVSSTIDTLIEDLKKILMQPMNTLFDTLPYMIREVSRDLSKEIELELSGGDIEVDRRVLEELKDPVIHLIRNAIDHGIEKPEERIKGNKSPKGVIRIAAVENEGNTVRLSISDDGKGMDFNRIKQMALKKGIITQKQYNELSEKEAILLAFHSEISTSQMITELSGRGLGLGIVADRVEKLGGHVDIDSIPGKGTTFILTLPLTLATFRGVHITIAGEDFIVPSTPILRVLRIKKKDIQRVEGQETIVIDKRVYSFIDLAHLLGMAPPEQEKAREFISVLIIKSIDSTMAFGVDYIHSEQEILVKSLSKQNMHIRNVMASTVLETGRVIPILNPKDLILSAIKGEKAMMRISDKVQEKETKKSILVAEDSITTRLLLTNILTSANYQVKSAADGVEAYEILQTQSFDLLITDLEMPRMSGFALTEKLRKVERFKDLPIIICTALGSREDREKGIELGANAYLDKSSFNHQHFLSVVKKFI